MSTSQLYNGASDVLQQILMKQGIPYTCLGIQTKFIVQIVYIAMLHS